MRTRSRAKLDLPPLKEVATKTVPAKKTPTKTTAPKKEVLPKTPTKKIVPIKLPPLNVINPVPQTLSFTGAKDTDREILLNLDNRKLILTCNLNTYFRDQVCDENFYERVLKQRYHALWQIPRRPYDKTWKKYFLEIVYAIARMEEEHKYIYVSGNPMVQLKILEKAENLDELMSLGVREGEINIVKLAVEKGADPYNVEDDDDMEAYDKPQYEEIQSFLERSQTNVLHQLVADVHWAD
jgi:hypothetical protein